MHSQHGDIFTSLIQLLQTRCREPANTTSLTQLARVYLLTANSFSYVSPWSPIY